PSAANRPPTTLPGDFNSMKWIPALCVSGLLVCAMAQGETATQHSTQQIERGRYLVAVGGCNDCHTPGFAPSDGNVPEDQHLLGSDIGYSGPWGVSYAGDLRLSAAAMTADQWRARARAGGLPPMPWPSLRTM